MIELTQNEHNKILLLMLKFITELCTKNDVHYSLIGGSLIGAIRHQGMIPWDDDIDIILMPDDLKKFTTCFENVSNKYKLLNPLQFNKNYNSYPFFKIINSNTVLKENNSVDFYEYGSYVDVFSYHYVSNFIFFRFLHYHLVNFSKKMISLTLIKRELYEKKCFIKKGLYTFINFVGNKRLIQFHNYICNINKKPTNYIMSNWPAYGFNKEIQKAEWMNKYKYVKFENIEAMISENYDDILKTSFDDYMQLPPENKRESNHSFKVYWKDGYGIND